MITVKKKIIKLKFTKRISHIKRNLTNSFIEKRKKDVFSTKIFCILNKYFCSFSQSILGLTEIDRKARKSKNNSIFIEPVFIFRLFCTPKYFFRWTSTGILREKE